MIIKIHREKDLSFLPQGCLQITMMCLNLVYVDVKKTAFDIIDFNDTNWF